MFCGTNSAVMPKYVSSIRYSINVAAEVLEQVEFGAFQKLGDKSTKKQGIV